ncbi:MAG TPA: xanthine dehydrogenase family protein molybdopterin-binding subunit [Chloroflexota bacterium]|nr:xanthine dehydrogenase family protein molybdopterin-binding subunit [Chloroflexota bacterium]
MATIAEQQAIGRPVPKPDAYLKATGTAVYAGDIRLPGMLEARVLRSPHPHARIVSIDTSEAEKLPGVFAVATGQDVSPTRIGRFLRDRHALAQEKVLYVGEPVAAVAAVDEETAERALQLIEVEYEPLPAVFDAREALAEGAPILHPDLPTYFDTARSVRQGNLRNRVVHEVGDVDAAFREPGLVTYEATYHTARQSQGFTEPRAAVAQVDGSGKVTVWASVKAPFRVRVSVADSLGVPVSRVRLISPVIGGDFGGKGASFIEPIVAVLARKAKRPVRLHLSRVEELTAMTSRAACEIRLKMGVRPDGTIVAMDASMLYNVGGVDDSQAGGANSATSLIGAYRIPNARVIAESVFTNTSPAGHVRAPSGPQTAFATESHLDHLARMLRMDPIELRLKNALHDGDVVPSGHGVLQNSGLEDCIERARAWMRRSLGPKRANQGVGLALGLWALHPNAAAVESAATVKIDVDGSVVVLSGIADQGGGQWTMVAQVASEVLGVPVERVSVVAADTEATPPEQGTGGSQTTYRVGNVVRQAAEDARRQLIRLAAEQLKADEEELDVADGTVFVVADPDRRTSVADVAAKAGATAAGVIIGTSAASREREIREHGHDQAEVVDAPSFACHVAQITVDPETGQISVDKYYTAQDVGRALNPLNCKGQIEGGVVFGLGYALTEEIISENGTNLNANLWEYLLPTAPHVPDLTVELVEVPSTYGPFGAKGVGETGCIAVAPAIANALEDAMGIRVTDLPLTPERVRQALQSRPS